MSQVQVRFPYQPDYAVLPGETLRETLEELEMTQADLARRTELSTKHINQIVQGAASITPETAVALDRVTGVPARFWNALEANYQARRARLADAVETQADSAWVSRFPIRELIRRAMIGPSTDLRPIREQLFAFFGVASRDAWERVWLSQDASFRRSPAFEADEYATACWLRLGELAAGEIETKPFDRGRFRDALVQIRQLIVEEPSVYSPRMVELCADAGVAVVFVREVAGTRASGAARWLTPNSALIQLSLRHQWEDHFWFSFFHEAGHVLRGGKRTGFIDEPQQANTDPDEEEANRFATTTLIPPVYESELRALEGLDAIQAFAGRIGLPPAIVVGRLHHEGLLPYAHGNRLRRRLHIVDSEN
jgi:HTH-type transcriptional regulator/antitoxin HigA